MSSVEEDKIREERITMEIIVDAHDKEERAMGWYYYLDDTLAIADWHYWLARGYKF